MEVGVEEMEYYRSCIPYGVEHTGTVAIQCSVWSGTYRDSCDTMFRMEWNIQGQLRYNVPYGVEHTGTVAIQCFALLSVHIFAPLF